MPVRRAAQPLKTTPSRGPAALALAPAPCLPPPLLALQRAAGNRAVTGLLRPAGRTVQRAGTGLAGKGSKKYAKKIEQARGDWDGLGLQERVNLLLAPANAALVAAGVPVVQGITDPLGVLKDSATYAGFDRGSWRVQFNDVYLSVAGSPETVGRWGNRTYHECRHAEQTFRVARKLAAERNDAATIAALLGIPDRIAKQATENPLSPKKTEKWAEAVKWQGDMAVGPQGEKAPADAVIDAKQVAEQEYEVARDEWQARERMLTDASSDPVRRKEFDDDLLKPGGAMRQKRITDEFRARYVAAKEAYREAYVKYVSMPVEMDAWSVGAQVEEHLKLTPATVEEELANLEIDEEPVSPVVKSALFMGSEQERKLLATLRGVQ